MKADTTSSHKIVHKLQLDEHDLRQMMRAQLEGRLKIDGTFFRDYEFHFKVPGGGDYSNQVLKIDKDNPIHVTITCTKET